MGRHRLLITGASGFLGYAVCRQARDHREVIALTNTRPVHVSGIRTVEYDLSRRQPLADLLAGIRPTAVLHLAAAAQPSACEQDPRRSARLNISASAAIARWCGRHGIPLVMASTDLVYDGHHAPYSETDPPAPICVYGRQKAAAETLTRRYAPHATVCRLPLMFGYAPAAVSGFFGRLVRTLSGGGTVGLFTDEHRTPVDTDSAARGLLMALDHPGRLLHLGGRVRLSRYTMGLMVADAVGAPAARITPLTLKAMAMPAPRSPDVSLSSEIADGLGYNPTPLEAAVGETIDRYLRDGRR